MVPLENSFYFEQLHILKSLLCSLWRCWFVCKIYRIYMSIQTYYWWWHFSFVLLFIYVMAELFLILESKLTPKFPVATVFKSLGTELVKAKGWLGLSRHMVGTDIRHVPAGDEYIYCIPVAGIVRKSQLSQPYEIRRYNLSIAVKTRPPPTPDAPDKLGWTTVRASN